MLEYILKNELSNFIHLVYQNGEICESYADDEIGLEWHYIGENGICTAFQVYRLSVHIICKVISKGTGFTYATQQGYVDGFLESVDGEQYCVWMWKGDYLNLGAGAETGIYKRGEPFWDVAVEDAMPMTLTTYDKDGNTIMCYMPDDPQWWITGFDSMTQDVDPDDLTVIGSIDMSSNPELWKAFKKSYNKKGFENIFCFDEENQTVYYNW